ncbi:MAG TPA: glycoside hydrolase family 3 C-terminal domain-containing protein, partial [Actinomycetales bacterium]|nr:glycoside hydrolase family 3 C-terminal domain-containing protein [Actinomycetales bacterium]
GTSGEGNDAPHLRLPGVQEEFARAIIDTGTPTILVLMTGRPYALGTLADDAAGILQAFFPGQRGGQAIAEILCGEIEPAGRLPFGIPSSPYAQPHTYLGPPLAQKTDVSNIDPEPRYPFGHGRSYGHTVWSEVRASSSELIVDGVSHLELDVHNDSSRPVSDVVQLYLHRPVAEVVQPVNRLIGYARVDVGPGETRRVHFTVPADVTAFTGLAGQRIVPPGPIELRIGRSVGEMHGALALEVIGERRSVDHNRSLYTEVEITTPAEMKS